MQSALAHLMADVLRAAAVVVSSCVSTDSSYVLTVCPDAFLVSSCVLTKSSSIPFNCYVLTMNSYKPQQSQRPRQAHDQAAGCAAAGCAAGSAAAGCRCDVSNGRLASASISRQANAGVAGDGAASCAPGRRATRAVADSAEMRPR